MRRKDREITDYGKILKIVEACDCCRIGLVSEGGAYIVPLNFGYENKGEELVLYFHGAGEGEKVDLIRTQDTASFEMDTKHMLVEKDSACGYSFLFQSIMGRGRIELLQDYDEKMHGLERVMAHYSDRTDWEFPEQMVRRMAVLKLTVDELSCKEHA